MGNSETTIASCEADAQLALIETTPQENIESLTVATLLARVKHSTALIEQLLEEHPEFASMNLRQVQKETQSNSVIKAIRQSVWSIFARAGWVLGRNSPEAVRTDLRSMLAGAEERIRYTNSPGRKSKISSEPHDITGLQGPELHIERVIEPLLDEDMKPYAYDMSTYYISPLKSFYSVLGKWRSEGRLVKVKVNK